MRKKIKFSRRHYKKVMNIKMFLLGAIILSLGIWIMINYLKEKDFIHIAFVGPMIGNGDAAGILMSRAIQLYLDTLNKKGGVNGKKIILD